ncbi:glutaminyl-peptide cyclotransferase [Aggregatimonas sangjinii]|uniref:Glutaminyl-peptide cyclotransferase n=1 Tax=Aggregatimonas sangjinii TaxID=2583587 RepID=A0A5B7SNW4_9FLAO|nr:glutaminyl-peptide cyclotransferase [Aggregatimonas sangjinii]QCX00227.1 glutaminyl-peptide cyclotransferase [Aggregatimonas sangjinii]
MNIFKFISLNLFSLLVLGCGDMDRKKAALFAIQLDGKEFKQNESVAVSIKNKDGKTVENVSYSIDGKTLELTDGKLLLDIGQLGNKVLKAKVAYDEGVEEVTKDIRIFAPSAPEVYTYEIIKEYPHDNRAYTQGLEFHDGVLYESTGKPGRSSLRKVDFETGKVLQQVDMDKTIFGEGITIFDEKIYMLSWKKKTGYIYKLSDLSKINNFQYGESKEGWGLTNNGTKLIKSDGTEKIWFLNPETLIEEGYIQTVTHNKIVNSANELEYVAGKIYANVYQKPSIMIIDATSGAIEGVVNFSGLSKKITKTPDWNDKDQVFNGIAYHPDRKTFFVTGKDWDKMFEVHILKK